MCVHLLQRILFNKNPTHNQQNCKGTSSWFPDIQYRMVKCYAISNKIGITILNEPNTSRLSLNGTDALITLPYGSGISRINSNWFSRSKSTIILAFSSRSFSIGECFVSLMLRLIINSLYANYLLVMYLQKMSWLRHETLKKRKNKTMQEREILDED